jgi:hypothetical protein
MSSMRQVPSAANRCGIFHFSHFKERRAFVCRTYRPIRSKVNYKTMSPNATQMPAFKGREIGAEEVQDATLSTLDGAYAAVVDTQTFLATY